MVQIPEKPKFFGRRQGRTIHKAKSFLLENFLPQIRVPAAEKIDINTLFGQKKDKYCLEIGFGDGDHLAALAKRNPQIGYIGVEVYKNGVANLLSLLTGIHEADQCENTAPLGPEAGRSDNVRVFDDDVRLLFAALPAEFFDKVYLLFPDPWPKTRHAERRFVNEANLRELARIIKKGGILQIATDHQVYKRWVMLQMRGRSDFVWTAQSSDDWRNPPADWAETKYQRKAVREGRRPVFFEYRRV